MTLYATMYHVIIAIAVLTTIAESQDPITEDTKDNLIGLLEQLVPENNTLSPFAVPITTPLPDCERCVNIYSTGYQHILNTYFIGPDQENTTSKCDIQYLRDLAQDIITIERSVIDCSNDIRKLISHMEISITALLALHCESSDGEKQTTPTVPTPTHESTTTSGENSLPRSCIAGEFVLTPLDTIDDLKPCRAYDQTMGSQPPDVLSKSHICPENLLFDTTSCTCNWPDMVNCSAQLSGTLPSAGAENSTNARKAEEEGLVEEIIKLVRRLGRQK